MTTASVEDQESLEETLDVMARPELVVQIRESLGEPAAGAATLFTKDQARRLG